MFHDPGRCRQRVTIEAPVRTPDGAGGYTVVWRPILDGVDVAAEVRALSAGERIRAQQASATLTHRVRMRYRPEVTAAQRLRYGARVLKIEGPPLDLGERRAWMELTCREDA